MSRAMYEKGDRVMWPETQQPASEGAQSFLTVENVDYTRYRSGKYYFRYLYEELSERLTGEMRENIEHFFDNLVVVIGDEGVGKSNLAYYLCKSFDPDFDLEKSYSYEWDTFIEQLDAPEHQKVYWLDEAINLASGREWMKEANKMLIKILTTMRSWAFTIVMCIPVFKNLDVYIRMHRTRYLLVAKCMRWPGDSS